MAFLTECHCSANTSTLHRRNRACLPLLHGHLRNTWFAPGRWTSAFVRAGSVLLPRPEGVFSLSLVILSYLAIFLWPLQKACASGSPSECVVGREDAVGGDGEHCRAYQAARNNGVVPARDLEDLRAAINHHAKEGLHRGIVRVSLPPRGVPRDRWLTRSEAARLIWTCWRAREMQKRHRGAEKGKTLPTDKRPLRHLARFILIGLYTGTRAGAIASSSPIAAVGRSFVHLERGIFYRLANGKLQTNNVSSCLLPPRLLAHMRLRKTAV